MSNWRDCLRFTEISKAEALFLMTDGVTNFALSDDACRLKNGFIEPINRYLKSEQNKMQALRALNNTLDTKQARRLNSDDKTFCGQGYRDLRVRLQRFYEQDYRDLQVRLQRFYEQGYGDGRRYGTASS